MNLFKGSLIASLLCLSPLCYAQIDDIDAKTKAKIESIIDEYVSTHPEIIIRAIQAEQNTILLSFLILTVVTVKFLNQCLKEH